MAIAKGGAALLPQREGKSANINLLRASFFRTRSAAFQILRFSLRPVVERDIPLSVLGQLPKRRGRTVVL
eukprot:1211641-Rhodomonas_salina.1